MVSVQQAVLLAAGPQITSVLPPAREFLLSAGFGGAAALLAVLLLVLVVVVGARRASTRHRTLVAQGERHHEQIREDAQRSAALVRCEERFKWVVETAGIEPAASEAATLGLGPELALELLQGLHRDAKQLGDDTLVSAITVYFDQLARVLAQQGGPLAHLRTGANGENNDGTAAGAEATTATRTTTARAGAEPKPDTAAPQPAPESPKADSPTSTTGRSAAKVSGRRRRS